MKRLFLFLLITVLAGACAKNANKTPEEAYQSVRNAYVTKNAKAFLENLTENSREEITGIIEPIREAYAAMEESGNAERAFAELAKRMGVPIKKLGSLTEEQYISYQMKDEQGGHGTNARLFPNNFLSDQAPTSVSFNEDKDKATLAFANGAALVFRNENKKWLLEINFSSVADVQDFSETEKSLQ